MKLQSQVGLSFRFLKIYLFRNTKATTIFRVALAEIICALAISIIRITHLDKPDTLAIILFSLILVTVVTIGLAFKVREQRELIFSWLISLPIRYSFFCDMDAMGLAFGITATSLPLFIYLFFDHKFHIYFYIIIFFSYILLNIFLAKLFACRRSQEVTLTFLISISWAVTLFNCIYNIL